MVFDFQLFFFKTVQQVWILEVFIKILAIKIFTFL